MIMLVKISRFVIAHVEAVGVKTTSLQILINRLLMYCEFSIVHQHGLVGNTAKPIKLQPLSLN
jgi:hypothetical protein